MLDRRLAKKIKRAIRLNGGKQKCLADGRWADVESEPRHGHRPTEPRPRHPPYSFCHSTRCISPAALRSASHALPQETLHCLQLLLCAKRLVSLTSSPRWCLPPGIIPSPSSVATLLLPTGHCNDVAVGLAFAATRSR